MPNKHVVVRCRFVFVAVAILAPVCCLNAQTTLAEATVPVPDVQGLELNAPIESEFAVSPLLQNLPPGHLEEPGVRRFPESKEKKFADEFWKYLLSNNYKHWSPLPGKSVEMTPMTTADELVQQAHGQLVKVYANRLAVGNQSKLPVGSILILENYLPDRSLKSISVVYRSPGFNPKANDWFWVDYQPDGSVTKQRTHTLPSHPRNVRNAVQRTSATTIVNQFRRVAGRENSCILCHQGAGGNDFVFSNDHLDFVSNPRPAKIRAAKKEPEGFRQIR